MLSSIRHAASILIISYLRKEEKIRLPIMVKTASGSCGQLQQVVLTTEVEQ